MQREFVQGRPLAADPFIWPGSLLEREIRAQKKPRPEVTGSTVSAIEGLGLGKARLPF